MPFNPSESFLKITRVAYHYVDPRESSPSFSAGEADISALSPAIYQFLLDLVAEVWHATDAGSTRSARFAQSHPRLGSSLARPWIEAACRGGEEFFPATRELARLLHAGAPLSASPGVLAVLRLEDLEGDHPPSIALLKLRYRDEQLIRLLTGDLPTLEVERVQKVLMKEIQKGALIPHPSRSEYELKVIDAQSREDPAAYFTEKFLGCEAKRSDELQIKKLVPTLERYAEEREVPIIAEKVACVLQELRAQPDDITAPLLVRAVVDQGLFGEALDGADFSEFVSEQQLDDLDIPQEEFQRSRKRTRRVFYRFVDPQWEGLEINGPPEAFEKVLRSENGRIIFRVETGPEGFRFDYR